jgi:hypothetical protein
MAATTFLVESYVPRRTDAAPGELSARLGAAAEALALDVHFLRAISLPEDETCFYLFEAPSAEAVRQVSERAGLRHERIVEAHPWTNF